MNKAFVRESDGLDDPRCPACGATGLLVRGDVLEIYLKKKARAKLGDSAYFCPTGVCTVAYFDEFERHIETTELAKPAYPKDPDAKICACFGLTAADIEKDVKEGAPTRVRALLEKAKSDAAQCDSCSASGQSCIPEVQRLYLRKKNQAT